MIFKIVAFISLFLINGSCTSFRSKNETRVKLMQNAISAIERYDTIQLYSIIDTSTCYSIYGSDGFAQRINYLNTQLKNCKASLDFKKIKSTTTPSNHTEYELPFCRESADSIGVNSFDVIFTFPDFQNNQKIMFMDIKKYLPAVNGLFSPPIKPN